MKLSIIIPVHNGGSQLQHCLDALIASTRTPDEIIVVDDASTDVSAQLASECGARVLSQGKSPLGPAKARNHGAESALGDILVFIDADVKVHADTLALIEKYMDEHLEIAALFGSYDDRPPYRSLVSLYKNLLHHSVHQSGKQEASTFWAGVGAIRREVFTRLGGFDERYQRPSIEDIELGVRLRNHGYRVWLCPDVQVAHLKQWKLFGLIRTDILDRAIPWTRLILTTSKIPSDLNLDTRSRMSAVAVWLLLLLVVLGLRFPVTWIGALLILGVLIAVNFPLYRLFTKSGGFWFAVGAFGLHLLYFIYSSLTFGVVTVWYLLSRTNRGAGA